MNEITTLAPNTNITLGPNFLEIAADASETDLKEAFHQLSYMKGATMFWIGDFLNAVEARKGELYAKAYSLTDYEPQTLWHAKSVCKKLPKEKRLNLSFAHHKEAIAETKGSVESALGYLEQAKTNNWSVVEMRKAIRLDLRASSDIPEPVKLDIPDLGFVHVLDAFGTVRRYLEQTDSTTLAMKKGVIVAELETLLELAGK